MFGLSAGSTACSISEMKIYHEITLSSEKRRNWTGGRTMSFPYLGLHLHGCLLLAAKLGCGGLRGRKWQSERNFVIKLAFAPTTAVVNNKD